jgi:hypothetical protein
MATRKTNTTIHSEGREIIANIIEKCDEEKKKQKVTNTTIESNQMSSYVRWSILLYNQENETRKQDMDGKTSG